MAESTYPALIMPEGVERETVTIWSNGIALDADIYRPAPIASEALLPGVVLSHGAGGSKATTERYAALIASSGMITISFTHSSWFGSGSPSQLIGKAPELDEHNEATVRVRFIRDLLDPWAWTQNVRAVLDYLEGEPHVDPDRIGLWGTSFGGGVAIHAAADDPRIKVLAVQVPAVALRRTPMWGLARQRAIATARGDFPAIPQGVDQLPGSDGTPYLAALARFDPLPQVDRLRIPTVIIDAGEEELYPTVDNGQLAAETIKSHGVPVEYHVIAGITHYGIYFDGYEFGSRTARDWFEQHL
ncbi:alpha/beta hydrolase fold domain-containing protein [Nocardia sp. NPDC005825]|uniref:alpha/beta hydrolase n=1 Tax=unclassified Nocardia TaxID=2637762 RepID=UPI0033C43348